MGSRPLPAAVLATFLIAALPAGPRAPWVPDNGDGTYRNPVLYADYSDPDVVRVGPDYYMTASSFTAVPGLPILHSTDLVNWRLVGHALRRLVPLDVFATPRHGKGVWAPAIRHHGGKFWIYYPDPDFGIYAVTARNPSAAWSTPALVKAGNGLIDPCPLWDDDGHVYLTHAWARSRAGFANRITLNRLSDDGLRTIDEGRVVIDGDRLAGYTTLEGPKIYKHGGFYWIFAPAGGVKTGWQSVFRSRVIEGPYEDRIVLHQGTADVNGPHQGAWVDTPSGRDWFLHFQDLDAYGRVVHLEPMAWRDDGWPAMGTNVDGSGKGEPARTWTKPAAPGPRQIETPQTSDEFDAGRLGLQWQWQANPRDGWLQIAHGSLRLLSQRTASPANLWSTPSLLLQKFPAPEFTATAAVDFLPQAEGEAAGLIVFGRSYAWVGVTRTAAGLRVAVHVLENADTAAAAAETEVASTAAPGSRLWLRVTVGAGARCAFSYSGDNRIFRPIGDGFTARPGVWVGAKIGLFAIAPSGAAKTGRADWNWFRIGGSPPARITWNRILDQPWAWYSTAEARRTADSVLRYQRDTGGWPKNIDMTVPPDRSAAPDPQQPDSTIDNGATVTQMRLLARVQTARAATRYRDAFNRGLDYLFAAQYPNGGWPQFYPLRDDYSRHITFNDDAMINVATLLADVRDRRPPFAFVDRSRRDKARLAVDRGVDVILRSQVRIEGRLTAWCAQHDEVTLEPRKARAYEHPSVSGDETVGIVRFLMRIDRPGRDVIAAIESAVTWLRSVPLNGMRVERREDATLPGGFDVVVAHDPAAPPLWARFYEIGTNRPIVSGRDGVVRYNLAEIEHERRIGYSWFGTWPGRLLDVDYPAWKKRISALSGR